MKRISRALLRTTCLAVAAFTSVWQIWATATAAEYEPHRVPRARFGAIVRTIALAPLRLPAGTPNAAALREDFETRLEAKVRERGYRVVPSAHYRRAWVELSKRFGGLYDPATGAIEAEQSAIARNLVLRELALAHGADVALYAELSHEQVEPYWVADVWDNRELYAAREPLTWRGQRIASLLDNRPQKVLAIAFTVRIRDLADVELFNIAAPLRWTHLYLAGGREQRPVGEYFSDPERNRKAVENALAKLEHATSAKP